MIRPSPDIVAVAGRVIDAIVAREEINLRNLTSGDALVFRLAWRI